MNLDYLEVFMAMSAERKLVKQILIVLKSIECKEFSLKDIELIFRNDGEIEGVKLEIKGKARKFEVLPGGKKDS